MGALSDRKIKGAKPRDSRYELADGDGLFVAIEPNGKKVFRTRHQHKGKRRRTTIGAHPLFSLSEARETNNELRKRLYGDTDPWAPEIGKATLTEVAETWIELQSPEWSDNYKKNTTYRIRHHLLPTLGHFPLEQITAPQLLNYLETLIADGKKSTAHKVKNLYGQIAAYGISKGLCTRNVCGDLKGALPPRSEKHHPGITDPSRLGELLKALEGYTGDFAVKRAIRLAPHLMLCPTELRAGLWSEIDLDEAVWRIPAERMKMKDGHIVPLSAQVVEILNELHQKTGRFPFLFPGIRAPLKRPISENTLNAALRTLGFTGDEQTTHGYRTTASTLLHERGFNRDHIEAQLAHRDGSIRGTYNAAEYLEQRREMMQSWSDYLDELRR